MKQSRREFLRYSAAGAVSTPLLAHRATAQQESDFGRGLIDQMSNVVDALSGMVNNPRAPLLKSAVEIGPEYAKATETIGLDNVHELAEEKTVSDTAGRAIIKVLKVCREYFGLGVDTGVLAKSLFSLSSIGGVVMGVSAVGESAYKLFEANTKRNIPREKIDGELYRDYLLSVLGLAMEVALITVPISFKPAWRGTRFVANRTLLRVRRIADGKYANAAIAVAMSILHWAQRALIDHSLTNAPKTADFVESVGEIVEQQTQEIRLDCSINTGDELPSGEDFQLFKSSAENVRQSLELFFNEGTVGACQMANLVQGELTSLGFEFECA